nr:hypothetical protein CFP56_26151 [Quercus suber]
MMDSIFMTANYLEMEEELALAQAKVKKLSTENTSLNESVKKIAAKSIKVKKEVEDAVKNFKASDEYSDKLMMDLNFSSLDIKEVKKEMLTLEAGLANATVMDTEVGARGGEGDTRSTILASGDATVV